MSASAKLHPDEKYTAGTLGSSLTKYAAGAGVVLLALSLFFGWHNDDSWRRFEYGFLTAWMFVFTIALGCLFFVMLHHITKARWSTVLLRIAENTANAFPAIAVFGFLGILLPMLAGNHQLYFWDWYHAHDELHGNPFYARLQAKATWLSPGLFTLRYFIYMGIYSGLAWHFGRKSREQDRTGDPTLSDRLRVHAGPAILLYALTTMAAGFDLTMTLTPEWYSTIYPVNMFGGAMLATYAYLAIFTRAIQRSGKLTRSVTTEHYHDLGKMMFGFNFFWAYTAFSPLLLIWYSNIPEEVVFYRYRWAGTDWYYFSIALILFHWAFPYVLLLSRWTKRILPIFMAIIVEQLFMHYIDLHWNVMPNATWHVEHGLQQGPLTGPLAEHSYQFAFSDWTLLFALIAFFLAAVGRQMKGNLVPTKNPTLGASLAFENY
jgi:hypothetical protein